MLPVVKCCPVSYSNSVFVIEASFTDAEIAILPCALPDISIVDVSVAEVNGYTLFAPCPVSMLVAIIAPALSNLYEVPFIEMSCNVAVAKDSISCNLSLPASVNIKS